MIGIVLGTLPYIHQAREAFRRRQCSNSAVGHSQFHGPSCSFCKSSIIGILRGSPGFTNDVRVRTLYVEIATPYAHQDDDILSALRSCVKRRSRNGPPGGNDRAGRDRALELMIAQIAVRLGESCLTVLTRPAIVARLPSRGY